jgi:DNA-binding LytR/AlgR family response regulator
MSQQQYKILIVEDEMIIGARLSVILTQLGYAVTGIIPRAEEVEYHLQVNAPDIILLDIQLNGDIDGIQLAKKVLEHYSIPIIFLTANADDATFRRARETKPYAFLTKPFLTADLQRAIELTISRMPDRKEDIKPDAALEAVPSVLSDRIFVFDKEKKVKIMFDDILYVQAERNYCRIITKEKHHILTMPMKSLEDQLPATLFQRIHRSYIINLKHVDSVDENSVDINGQSLSISKSFKKEFHQRIRII